MSSEFLYDYQLEALSQMKNGCILNGGVGSGKSRTSVAYYCTRNGGDIYGSVEALKLKDPKDLYIITTAKKRDQGEWESDMNPFGLSSHDDICKWDCKVTVDSWNNIGKYVSVKDAFFIFDEQRLVGSGKWVKSFYKIVKGNNEWILLTATPGDTWIEYVPVFVANGFYKNRTQFIQRHVIYDPFARFPKIKKYDDEKWLLYLKARITVEMDFERETERHYEKRRCFFNREKYKQIFKDRWNPFKAEPIETAGELCLCLRKVCNTDPSRGEMVLDICEDHPRAIVFYNFDYEREILLGLPYLEGTVVAEWNGHKHQPIPDSSRWVYLVQYTAGCEGWNCTSTDTIIFYSLNYSYKVMEQSSGRIDRVTTKFKDLYYYYLMSDASIDFAILKAIRSKRDFNAKTFTGM